MACEPDLAVGLLVDGLMRLRLAVDNFVQNSLTFIFLILEFVIYLLFLQDRMRK